MDTCLSMSLYVLALQHDKYFVGKCEPGRCAKAMYVLHLCFPDAWLSRYCPLDIKADGLHGSLDRVTVQYMQQYGLNNVRGGRFSSPVLSSEDIDHIRDLACQTSC